MRDTGELDEVRARHGLPGSFVLCTGTLEPRKNLLRLIDAFVALPDELRAGHELALVGPRGWEAEEIEQRVAAHSAVVRVLGYVSDDDLAALYQSCTAFCYPSLYEGFGLPVLEAMTCGAPVLASDIPSLREVAGDAALYVDPLDTDAIRAGLERLLGSGDERGALAERGRGRAQEFSWDRTARELLAALDVVRLQHQ